MKSASVLEEHGGMGEEAVFKVLGYWDDKIKFSRHCSEQAFINAVNHPTATELCLPCEHTYLSKIYSMA